MCYFTYLVLIFNVEIIKIKKKHWRCWRKRQLEFPLYICTDVVQCCMKPVPSIENILRVWDTDQNNLNWINQHYQCSEEGPFLHLTPARRVRARHWPAARARRHAYIHMHAGEAVTCGLLRFECVWAAEQSEAVVVT